MSIPRGIKCSAKFPAGQAWAALDDKKNVVNVISKKAPKNLTGPDYEAFKDSAKKALAALGRVVSGDVVYDGERCYFVPFNSRADAKEQRFVEVNPKGDWKAYQAAPVEGWKMVGTVSVGGVTGALARALNGEGFAQILNGIVTELPAAKVKAALHQAIGATTGNVPGQYPCAHGFPAGLYWAAVKDGQVVAVVPRPGKDSPDYEQAKANALDVLASQGTVMRGRIVKKGDVTSFLKAKS